MYNFTTYCTITWNKMESSGTDEVFMLLKLFMGLCELPGVLQQLQWHSGHSGATYYLAIPRWEWDWLYFFFCFFAHIWKLYSEDQEEEDDWSTIKTRGRANLRVLNSH